MTAVRAGRGTTTAVAPARIPSVVGAAIALAAFIAIWKLIVIVSGFPPFILPTPELVGARFVSAWADGTIAPHASRTLYEVAVGFGVGASFALIVGYLLARLPLAERLLSPYLVAAQAIPILALAPLLALWFGPGLTAKFVICALIVFFPVAIATMVGFRAVDGRLLELARSLRASRWQIVTTLEIPAALPAIFGGLRVGVTLAVVGAIVGEWAGADRGLGLLVNIARGSLFDIPLLFATLLTIALLGIALYGLVVVVERALVGAR
ncbi:MAG TPA: ABC transporter permease [Candidatus Dormibacteraeota bacterium]|nr:ABC transporter permease [Candidatus Dormibacteraeota bacterium]